MWSALLSAFALALAPQSAPQPPGVAEQDAGRLADIIVDGRRMEEAARSFIEEIGAPPPGTRPGRWNSEICISVTGMQERYAQYLIDRVAIAALDAGAEVQGPGCKPNVIILATSDGPALASHLVDEVGLGFRPAVSSTNLGRRALEHFRSSDAPVRWWHVTMPIEPDSGQVAIALRGQEPPGVTVRDASRLRSNIRYDIAWAIIIVDMSRTGGVPFGAVADYVALTALTQLDPFADMSGEDTVLNLFRTDRTVAGLTDWDKDYLAALYSSRADRATDRQQINDVVTRLTQVRGEAELRRGEDDAGDGD
jgi:hypothetical protein